MTVCAKTRKTPTTAARMESYPSDELPSDFLAVGIPEKTSSGENCRMLRAPEPKSLKLAWFTRPRQQASRPKWCWWIGKNAASTNTRTVNTDLIVYDAAGDKRHCSTADFGVYAAAKFLPAVTPCQISAGPEPEGYLLTIKPSPRLPVPANLEVPFTNVFEFWGRSTFSQAAADLQTLLALRAFPNQASVIGFWSTEGV
jgi:hypothetical protein